MYEYLNNGSAVRFTLQNMAVPNFEVKFTRKNLDVAALKDKISVLMPIGKIYISSLERQIAFKS